MQRFLANLANTSSHTKGKCRYKAFWSLITHSEPQFLWLGSGHIKLKTRKAYFTWLISLFSFQSMVASSSLSSAVERTNTSSVLTCGLSCTLCQSKTSPRKWRGRRFQTSAGPRFKRHPLTTTCLSWYFYLQIALTIVFLLVIDTWRSLFSWMANDVASLSSTTRGV